MLQVGDEVPRFSLVGDDGKPHGPADHRGKTLVVYFYPKDDTPGCTREAVAFSKLADDFAKAGAVVYGVSRDSTESHCRFRDKHKLGVRLLSDPTLEVHRAFGAWGEKTMYGKKVEGVLRSTFLIGPDGKIAHVWPSVKVDGHAEAVLAALVGEAPKAPAKKAPAKRRAPKKVTAKKVTAKPPAPKKKDGKPAAKKR
jgi:peroxiredoxin Q/BCP